MSLHSNVGKMLIVHKLKVSGYKPHVWFDQKSITNLIALKNLINKYRVTNNSLDDMFIIHKEEHGKHNMHFKMNESGLHYYDQEYENFVFVNTVAGNKESYSKIQIKDYEQAM